MNTCLKEVGCEDTDWIYLGQETDKWRVLLNSAMNFRASRKAGNFLTEWENVCFLRKTLLKGVN